MAQPLVYTTAEVARLLQISESHVRRLAAAGVLPCRRFGRRLRFPRVRLDQFLADQTQEAS